MASSLGELLAADGFAREERPKQPQRPSTPPPRPPPGRAGSVASSSSTSTRPSLVRSRKSAKDENVSEVLEDVTSPSRSSKSSGASFGAEGSRKSRLRSRRDSESGSEENEENFEELSYKHRYDNELYEEEEEEEASNAPMKAVVSILTGYIARFLDDARFRASIRRRCNSCLGPAAAEDRGPGPAGILRRAIAAVERAAEGGAAASAQELKMASLKLSLVVAGLEPGSRVAACARLYLAAACKLGGRDEASAGHLLGVFSGCPGRARTLLLPELWGRLFPAHLSGLTDRFFEEVEAAGRAAGGTDGVKKKKKKLALLEEEYNSRLDAGTGQLAVYYKEWLAGGEPPRIPCVPVPRSPVLVPESSRGGGGGAPRTRGWGGSPGLSSPGGGGGGYHATLSRALYESVFEPSRTKREEEEEEEEEDDKHSLCSPDQLSSSSEDDEWAARRHEAGHRSVQLKPTFSARVRTSLLPPWGKSPDV